MTIKLIVGLGNPGPQYSKTRHNAGAWLIEELARSYHFSFKSEPKFKASIAKGDINGTPLWLCIPSTYMNLSGQAVSALAQFYKISPQEILVCYDEIDLSPGIVRLKLNGGHGGHNGMRDIFSRLGSKEFYRLRIGVGHPGHKDDVVDYVLKKPSRDDSQKIHSAIDRAIDVLPKVISGQPEQAMNILHTES